MFRFLIVSAILFQATALLADEPADIEARLLDIDAKFAEWQKRARGATEGPEYDKAIAERNEAFKQLAAEAEAAGSSDHLTLAQLYTRLDRRDDAVRELRKAIEGKSAELKLQRRFIQATTELKLPDEALAAFRRWLAMEIDAAGLDAYLAPLEAQPKCVEAMLRMLVEADRQDDARQAHREMMARFDQLAKQFADPDASRVPRRGTPGARIDGVRIANLALLARIVPRPQRPAVGGGAPAMPERPSVAMPSRRGTPTEAPTRPERAPATARSEYYAIFRGFNEQFRGKERTGPEFEQALAKRNEELTRLAARVAAAKSVDYLTLGLIHLECQRRDEAVAALREISKAEAIPLGDYEPLLKALADADMADEIVIVIRRWVAADFQPTELKVYVSPCRSLEHVTVALCRAKRVDEAREVTKQLQERLQKIKDGIPVEPKVEPKPGEKPRQVTLDSPQMIARQALFDANRIGRELDRPEEWVAKHQPAAPGAAPKPASITDQVYEVLRLHRLTNDGDYDPLIDPQYARRRSQKSPEELAAEGKAALEELLARALKDHPTDHAGLALLYRALKRPTDLDDQLRRFVEAGGNSLKSQVALTFLLSRAGRIDDAVAQFRRWTTLEIAPADAAAYLDALPTATFPLPLDALYQAERFDDIQLAISDWTKQLDAVQAKIDALPADAKPASKPMTEARQLLGETHARLRDRKLAGGVRRVNGQTVFYKPLDVDFEYLLINREYAQTNLSDAEALRLANMRRQGALEQLAAAAEAAQSQAHATLASINFMLGRHDRAATEAQLVIAANDKALDGYRILIESLCKLGKHDDALAAFKKFQAVEVSDSLVSGYLRACSDILEQIVGSLIDSNRLTEADETLKTVESQLGKLTISPREQIGASNLRRAIASLLSDLNVKRKPASLRQKK